MPKLNTPGKYAVAVAAVALGLILRWVLQPFLGSQLPFSTVFLVVLVVASFFGRGPALLATVLGGVGAQFLVVDTAPSRLILYLASAALTIWVTDVLRRSRTRAAAAAERADQHLRELQDEMDRGREQRELSAQLRAIVESSSAAILSIGLDGTIRSWNRGAENVFGYPAPEVVGKPISILMPPGLEEEETGSDGIRGGTRVQQLETVRVRRDGARIQVALTISPIYDSAGEITGVSYIARDITVKKQLEERMREMQKLESLGVLAGGLAHDLNNVLTGIMGNASLALSASRDPVVRERLDDVVQASERAAQLIRQLLAFAGKGRFVVQPLNFSKQVTSLSAALRSSVPSNIQLNVDVAAEVPLIEADESQVQQVIRNLVTNAVEAIGDQPGAVSVSTRVNSGSVIFEVQDNGSGMTEEVKARIFEPFYTTKFPGRGLGLAAVGGIVHKHGGDIHVESCPGRGSTFSVSFPAAGLTPPVDPTQSPGEILIADDEESIRQMARLTLEQFGYRVHVAAGGSGALQALDVGSARFAAVLLDLTATDHHGEPVLHRIAELRPELPLVISSSYSEREARERFHAPVSAVFLRKPYTARGLAQAVAEALEAAPGS